MSAKKYIVVGIRNNFSDKPDYLHVVKYTDDSPVLFSKEDAEQKAINLMNNPSYPIYGAKAILVTSVRP